MSVDRPSNEARLKAVELATVTLRAGQIQLETDLEGVKSDLLASSTDIVKYFALVESRMSSLEQRIDTLEIKMVEGFNSVLKAIEDLKK